jgi:hypothetical protein
MTLLASIRRACARAVAAAGRLARAFSHGGPVGVVYTVKLARIKRRMANVSTYIHRENELHRSNLAALNHELSTLIDEHQATNLAARHFWRADAASTGAQS